MIVRLEVCRAVKLKNGQHHKQVFCQVPTGGAITEAGHQAHFIWVIGHLIDFLHLGSQLPLLGLLLFHAGALLSEQSLYLDLQLLE